MMTVRMNNTSHPSKERVQRLQNKNVGLENKRLSAQPRIPSDPNAWQQKRENYEAMILQDRVLSEQHEIEYALWQLHYKRIEELRAHLSAALASASRTSPTGKDLTQPDRITKIRSQLKSFLSETSGFYHDLMLKIRAKYDLPLGYFSDDQENSIFNPKDENKSTETNEGLISCHRCLIYLGDLARYKGLYGEGESKSIDFAAASSYYMRASSLWPSSGNPHHQLAILASYSGDDLVSVYHYFRSLAIDNPFSVARDNLIMAFEKNRQSYSELSVNCKASSAKFASAKITRRGRGKGEGRPMPKEYKAEANAVKKNVSYAEIFGAFSIQFIRLNGILFTRTSLETFEEVLSKARNSLIQLLSTSSEEFSVDSSAVERGFVIVRIVAILIFTVHNAYKKTEDQSYAEILQGSVLRPSAFTATFELMGKIFEKCSQLPDPSTSYMCSGVLVFVEWLACRPDVVGSSELEERQEKARSFFWNICISLLNKLLLNECFFNDEREDYTFSKFSRYNEVESGNSVALWEDFELRGFLPLAPAHLALDFSRKHTLVSYCGIKERETRLLRIISAVKALENVIRIDQQGVYFDSKLQKFVVGGKPNSSNDELRDSSLGPTNAHPGKIEKQTVCVEPRQQCYMDGEEEEEDEVIVFKPSVSDKRSNVVARKVTREILPPVSSVEHVPLREGFINAFDISSQPPYLANIVSKEQLQPNQPCNYKLLLDQLASFSNGLNNLNIEENEIPFKHEFQGVTHFPPTAVSSPCPGAVKLSSDCMYSSQDPEIPSKFDPIISSGASFNSISVKNSALPARSVRSPVSRPVRHIGPPPGFNYSPPKMVEEPLLNCTIESANLQMDDYSWLDGYQLSTTQETALNNSVKYTEQKSNHATLNNSLIETPSFPFPGKQVSGQHQQFQEGNQLSMPMSDQYHGRSLWDGTYFV